MSQPTFFYDLCSVESYLAAERSHHVLGLVPEWRPVGIAGSDGAPRAALEALALDRGLQPLRWPEAEADRELALRAAVYARQIGKVVAFSLAAFRQQFAGGRALDETTILLAGAACEIHPRALLKALTLDTIATEARRLTDEAVELGVSATPAFLVSGELFTGDAALEAAARAVAA